MSASLELLSGKKKAAVPNKSATPAEPAKGVAVTEEAGVELLSPDDVKEAAEAVETVETAATETEVEIDPDTMTSEELDALVKEHEIEVPKEWKKWKADGKAAWLKEQFEEREEIPEGIVEADQTHIEKETAVVVNEPEPVVAAAVEEPKTKTAVSTALGGETKKTTKKSKPSGKDLAQETIAGEILPPSELSDLVHDIENLVEKDAKEMASKLADASDFMIFQLGGVLSVIQANGWFAPYANLKEYVEKAHGILYRKAVYYIKIYNGLVESKVPWSEVKHLGWTKLKELADLMTLDNYKDWVGIAEDQTTLQLIETIAKHKQAQAGQAQIGSETSTTVTTKTFKVHEDQKDIIEAALDKAKEEGSTSVDTVALTYICQEYVAGPAKLSLKQRMEQAGIEQALEAISLAFPTYDFNVVAPE